MSRKSIAIAMSMIVLLVLLVFAETLFTSKSIVLSQNGTDISEEFLAWRKFAADEISHGNFPLWCPNVYCGIPFFGGIQSALLYPFNFLFLILSLPKALNFTLALQLALAGVSMFWWARARGLHPAACLFSAVILMFCGPHFLHVFPGHLSNLCIMPWIPLLFLAVDRLFEQVTPGRVLLGVFAVTIQILSGQGQYLFYTFVAVVIYSGFRLIRCEHRGKTAIGLAGIYVGAALLSAVQLLTTFDAVKESIRGEGISFAYASMFSFPPENLITLIAPGFLGTLREPAYWGRCYLWEMSLFIGVTGLALAAIGAIAGERQIRRFSLPMVLVLFVLALGSHTPVFKILYQWIPGFDKFRGASKFTFQASLFLILLSGIGLDYLIRRGFPRRNLVAVILLVCAVVLGVFALTIRNVPADSSSDSPDVWMRLMTWVQSTQESYLPNSSYEDPEFLRQARFGSANSILLAAGTILALSAIAFLSRFSNKVVYILLLLGITEVFAFAWASRASFDLSQTSLPYLESFAAHNPGDYRVLNSENSNWSMVAGLHDIWGNDPEALKRFCQFVGFTQERAPEESEGFFRIHQPSPLFSLLRCAYIFGTDQTGIWLHTLKNPMSRFHLLGDYKVLHSRDEVFKAMGDPKFNPRKTVILEDAPDPKPTSSQPAGQVKLLDSSTDHMTIEASLTEPAILLITDAYSKGWIATPLQGSSQTRYEVMPANYTLRAIPLGKGEHRFRLEYLPQSFRIGKWISIVSLAGYLALVGWVVRRRWTARRRATCFLNSHATAV